MAQVAKATSVLGAMDGRRVDRVLVVGCEPESVEERMGLSDVVAAAVDPAVSLVGEVLDEVLIATTAGGK